MVGLPLLTHRYNLSDAEVVQGMHENLDGMALCGIDVGVVLEQAKPGEPFRFVDASTLTNWRRRLGPAGMPAVEAVIHYQLVREKGVAGRYMVTDTTAQEKAIAYPTDTALRDKGRRPLVQLIGQAKAAGIGVAQGLRRFTRTATQVVLAAAKCGHARLERIEAANRQLGAMAQHVLRRVPRVLAQLNGKVGAVRRRGQAQAAAAVRRLREHLQHTAGLVRRIIHQNAERFQGRQVSDKVWSLHAPHVVSICKGKRAKPTEDGCKVSVSIDRQGFIITHTEYARNIVNAETLPDAIESWIQVFGQPPPEVAGDRGFHHPEAERAPLRTAGIPHLSIPRTGKTRHPDADTAWFTRLQRLRSHIEPVLSHL
jgi:transposase, IS5 family